MATDVRIGGRLEAVAPRRVTDPGDRIRLLVLVAVAIVVHVWVLTHTRVTARDSIGFARYALQLENPSASGFTNIVDVLTDANTQHPPGYPLAVMVASWPVRAICTDLDLPAQMLKSAQVASCVAAVLLVLPTYWLGRTLFGKFVGFAAALMFQVLPVPAEITSDGLTEGLYLLGLGTALLLGVRAVMRPTIGRFLLCGLTTGLTYLVRPEGLAVALAVGLVLVGLGAFRRATRGQAAAGMTALAVGTVLPAVPYMALIGGVTNKPAGNQLIQMIQNPRQMITSRDGADARPHAGPPVAAWYDASQDGSLTVWVVEAIAKELTKAFHYFPFALALLGVILAVPRLRAEPWILVPLVYGMLMLLVIAAMAYIGQNNELGRQHYVSERHTLTVVYVGCLFAAYGLERLPGLLQRISLVGDWPGHPLVAWALLLGIVISSVPKLVRPLHANREGHVHAGRYIREHIQENDTLIDPFEWAQFYAGRSLRHVPTGDPTPVPGQNYRWAVLEQGESSHSRLPRLEAAQNVASDGANRAEIVYWWPGWPDGSSEDARVVVYRQLIK